MKGWRLGVLGLAVTVVVLGGVGEVPALLVGGLVGALWLRASGYQGVRTANAFLPVLFLGGAKEGAVGAAETGGLATLSGAGQTATAIGVAALGGAGTVSLWKLFFFFLKVGTVLYGSGYVLVAFLEGGLVQGQGWLTQAQLLDAIAVGQFTPGPVLSTSTFVGYLIDGASGAAAATLGIFLPSFLFVLLLNPLIPRLRQSVWLAAFLDAVSVAAVALMLSVTIEIGMATLTTWGAGLIAVLAAVAALRFSVNAAWLVLGGGVLGLFLGP